MDSIHKDIDSKETIIEQTFLDILKAIVYSSVGIFIFFIPLKINGNTTTFLYHIVYKLQSDMMPFLKILIVSYILLGCIKLFLNKKSSKEKKALIVPIMSLLIIINIFYGNKSISIVNENTLLLIEEIVINVGTTLPISALFLTFLLNYGVLDIVESFFHSSMKKMFKMSGKCVVNIFIYMFTDCFCGFLATNKMYKNGKLRENEACMLILNFSVVSFQTITYICDELNINKFKLTIVSFVVLLIINMILCRIYPLSKKKKSYYVKTNYKETVHKKDKFKKGINKYLQNKNEVSIIKQMIDNVEESFNIITKLIPSIVIVLFLGDILINNEFIIDNIKYGLYPFISLFKLQNPDEISKFIGLAFFNDIIGIDSVSKNISILPTFVIGVIATLKCISLSTNMLYTKHLNLSISNTDFFIVYIQRIILILVIYCLMYYSLLGYIM